MSDLLWVKMPSAWIAGDTLRTKFSSSNQLSTEIASLKIYMCLCLFSRITQRKRFVNFLNTEVVDDNIESILTYDQISNSTSLSRLLVSKGLKKLKKEALIKDRGTKRKVIYEIVGNPKRGWCKLPRKDLLKTNDQISGFGAFINRYEHERDALKLFLFLLSVRSNNDRYTDVSRGVISKRTGIELHKIDNALGFLQSIGFLEKAESKGYLRHFNENLPREPQKLHRYYVTGCRTLNLRPALQESYNSEF